MGIKNLGKFLKEKSPRAYFRLPLKSLSGKRVAIDGNGLMYRQMSTSQKKIISKTNLIEGLPDRVLIQKEFLNSMFLFINSWLASGITPVFVFDGEASFAKSETRASRKHEREKLAETIRGLQAQLKGNILDQPINLVATLRKHLFNHVVVNSEDYEMVELLIKTIGIPFIKAASEAEHLCSVLAVEGVVAAVYSKDSDNLTYGCPLQIKGPSDESLYDEDGQKIDLLDCVRLDYILDDLEMSQDQFVDFCIMCGCDHNVNIPHIGPSKSFDLIKKYGTIDSLPSHFGKTPLTVDVLHHWVCRKEFQYFPSLELIKEYESFNINPEMVTSARPVLDNLGLSRYIGSLLRYYQIIGIPNQLPVENLDIKESTKYKMPIRPKLVLNIISSSSTS